MVFYQEIFKVREWIPHIAPLTKVIPPKLFLDIVPSSSANITRALRGQSKYNFWRLRDELVGNYYSDGTLERLAVHLGLLKDYLKFLAGDLSHSRSVSRSVRLLYFLGFRFDLIYSCKSIVECPFLGVSCCCIRWGIRFHIFFGHI